jgi:hypothetical protein
MTALIRIDRSLTPSKEGDRSKPIRFCSRCGHPSEEPARRQERFARERVCRRCGMGMMLSSSRDALPGTAASFLVVTFDLRVSAVSEAGEKIFGREQSLMGKPLLDLLSSPLGNDQLARHAGQAAQRAREPVVMPVRLASDRARHVGTMAARIATCGTPRAALITVEPSGFGKR